MRTQKTYRAKDNGAEIWVRRNETMGVLYRVPGFWLVPGAVILREATPAEVAWVEAELDLGAAAEEAAKQAE